jgi:polyisoprenoid-binding protein YceI
MNVTAKVMMVFAGAAITLAAAPPLGQLKFGPDSKVWVTGSSTVKDFKCTSKAVDATLGSPSSESPITDLERLVTSAQIVLTVEQLDCSNGTMNEHMRKALNAKQYPRIEFKLLSYQVDRNDVSVKGMLTMNGQEHPIEMTGKVADEEGTVRSSATRQINMTEWGIKPPSLMMGTMKVKPVVTIGYDIAIKR